MKKRLLTLLLCAVMAFGISACGSGTSSNSSGSGEEKVYVKESEFDELFTNPDQFKGKYVILTGQLLDAPEKNGDTVTLQAWYDTKNYSQNFIVYTNETDESFSSNDYIIVDGIVDGELKGENYFGEEVTAPLITDAKVTKSTYKDVVAPTVSEILPNATAEQKGFTVSVEKVEYSDVETRVYMTVANNTNESISFGAYDIKILLDNKQINIDNASSSMYDGNYPELSYDIAAGASTSGVLVFPIIEQGKDFQIIVPDIFSDNYEEEFSDMKIDISTK